MIDGYNRALSIDAPLSGNPPPDTGPAPRPIDRDANRTSVVATLIAIYAYRELVRNLVLKELKLKYRGSVLGFLWSLINPLAMVGVYTLAFKYIIGVQQPGFSFFILLGVMAWTFFANSAMLSTGAIVDGSGLIRAVRFPRAVLPLATVIFGLIQYLLTVVALLPLMFIVYKLPPPGPLLLFPIFLALQVAFVMGVALVLAAATTFFRDVRHFVEIALSMLFWLTPIVYPLTQAPPWLRPVLLLSPMSPFVVAYQDIFYLGVWPSAIVWAGALVYGVGVFSAGMWWFLSLEPRISEQLL